MERAKRKKEKSRKVTKETPHTDIRPHRQGIGERE